MILDRLGHRQIIWINIRRERRDAIVIVHQYRRSISRNIIRVMTVALDRGASYHVEVVVVVAGDGQVPHPAVMDGRGRSADDYNALAVRGLEMIARFEVICRNPAVVRIRVPEPAAAGGVDDLGAAGDLDGKAVQVGVMVDLDGGDRPGLVLADAYAGGEDLAASSDPTSSAASHPVVQAAQLALEAHRRLPG